MIDICTLYILNVCVCVYLEKTFWKNSVDTGSNDC